MSRFPWPPPKTTQRLRQNGDIMTSHYFPCEKRTYLTWNLLNFFIVLEIRYLCLFFIWKIMAIHDLYFLSQPNAIQKPFWVGCSCVCAFQRFFNKNHKDLPPSSSLSWFLSDAVVSGPELSSMEMKLTGLEPGPVVVADNDDTADSRGNMARIRCNSFRSRSRSSSRSWMISWSAKKQNIIFLHL